MNKVGHHLIDASMTADQVEKTQREEQQRLNELQLMTQTARFCVAPGQAITTTTRGIIDEGGEVTFDDFRQTQKLDDGTILELNAPEVTMGSLVARGLVLEKAVS